MAPLHVLGLAWRGMPVYRPSPDSEGGLGVTARVMGAPDDRNVVDLFAQGGVKYKDIRERQ